MCGSLRARPDTGYEEFGSLAWSGWWQGGSFTCFMFGVARVDWDGIEKVASREGAGQRRPDCLDYNE